MPNRNYLNGRAKEYRIVNKAKKEGKIALRSAGSHSPVDVVIIDPIKREINLVQSKLGYISEPAKMRILNAHKALIGEFRVTFEVL